MSSEYLVQGEYVFDDFLTYIHLKDESISAKANNLFKNSYTAIISKKSSLKMAFIFIIKYIFFNKVIVNKKTETDDNFFRGTVYLPVGNGEEVRIFDLLNNKISLIFSDRESYNDKINNYRNFQQYFSMPALLSYNNEKLLIIEEYIDFVPNHSWRKEDYLYVMEDIFNREINYFEKCKKKCNYIFRTPLSLLEELPNNNEFIDFIKNNIKQELMNIKFPFLKLHGDLWISNILLKKEDINKVYYIDWEYSKDFIMFYDLFFMILNEAYINNNYIYIEKYILGEYDGNFEEIFQIFEMTFKKKYRLDYLYIYLINQYIDRRIDLGQN